MEAEVNNSGSHNIHSRVWPHEKESQGRGQNSSVSRLSSLKNSDPPRPPDQTCKECFTTTVHHVRPTPNRHIEVRTNIADFLQRLLAQSNRPRNNTTTGRSR